MEVSFDDPDLAGAYSNQRELQKKHGLIRAKRIQQRLRDLRRAESLRTCGTCQGDITNCMGIWRIT